MHFSEWRYYRTATTIIQFVAVFGGIFLFLLFLSKAAYDSGHFGAALVFGIIGLIAGSLHWAICQGIIAIFHCANLLAAKHNNESQRPKPSAFDRLREQHEAESHNKSQ